MARKLYSAEEALALILAEDSQEDIDGSDYGNDSDFEDESESENEVSFHAGHPAARRHKEEVAVRRLSFDLQRLF